MEVATVVGKVLVLEKFRQCRPKRPEYQIAKKTFF